MLQAALAGCPRVVHSLWWLDCQCSRHLRRTGDAEPLRAMQQVTNAVDDGEYS